MDEIIKAEMFKLWKKRVLLGLLLLSTFSLIYALGVFFNWKFIAISGRVDVISFITTMWTLLIMLGVPLILFSYLGASILGGEIDEGQILLEVNRASSKSKLVLGKEFSLGIALFLCYAMNFVLSFVFYKLFVASSIHGYVHFEFQNYHLHMVLISLVSILFLMVFIAISMLLSIKYGVFRSTILSICIFVAIKFLGNINQIASLLPGYYTIRDDAGFSVTIILYQFILLVTVIILLSFWACRKFEKKQY